MELLILSSRPLLTLWEEMFSRETLWGGASWSKTDGCLLPPLVGIVSFIKWFVSTPGWTVTLFLVLSGSVCVALAELLGVFAPSIQIPWSVGDDNISEWFVEDVALRTWWGGGSGAYFSCQCSLVQQSGSVADQVSVSPTLWLCHNHPQVSR